MKNVTLCYLENEKGEYLMLHRVKKQNDLNHDKWIGVGGKFEPGESPEECICRETLEETGLTLTEYITKYRLERAQSLMRDTAVPLTQIAEQTGYSDVSYFSRSFKKYFGVSPRAARIAKA